MLKDHDLWTAKTAKTANKTAKTPFNHSIARGLRSFLGFCGLNIAEVPYDCVFPTWSYCFWEEKIIRVIKLFESKEMAK